MSKPNELTLDELVDNILSVKGYRVSRKTDVWSELLDRTSALPEKSVPTERALYVKFDITKQAKCPVCGNQTTVNPRIKDAFVVMCCSYKCSAQHQSIERSKIDPVTGLSKYDQIHKKTSELMTQVDPRTGVSKAQVVSKKTQATLNSIDELTGMTRHQLRTAKSHKTRSIVDPVSGKTNYEITSDKTHRTLSKVNQSTGLTGYQTIGRKIKKARAKIDPETGLTLAQTISIKAVCTIRSRSYDETVASVSNEFTILTTIDDFCKSTGPYITYECNECKTVRTSSRYAIRCLECNPYFISVPEKQVFDFCCQYTAAIESSNRALIYPLEVDIYSEKHKLAIEFDGVYWHSSDSVVNEKRNYHLEKTQLCEQQGIQLLHVFENEWADLKKQTIWKSIIRNKFGESKRIFARKCVIREVDSKTTKMFLENNHLQGRCPSSINYGLYYEDELVSLMTFGKPRYNKKYKYELLRFCNILNTSVTGGASRLFKHFIKNHKGSVISYADKRRSNGNLYNQLGFELSHETDPNYFYIDNIDPYTLHSRVKFQKHKLSDLLEIFDKSKTESENMYNNGYRKIFDCGNYVFTYINAV